MRAADIDDVLIVSHQQSQVANLWVNYLSNCFDQLCKKQARPPLKVQCVSLDELAGVVSLAHEERMSRVKLQLIVMCPTFLQRLAEHPYPSPTLRKILQPERVLLMLLGVDEQSITKEQKSDLGSFNQWRRMQVRDKDSKFVGEFLNEAVSILARSTAEQHSSRPDRAAFSLLPKKVKHSHNKVIILLNDPLEKEDRIKVTVNKNGELLDVNTVRRRNPYTLLFLMPDTCLTVSMLVTVYVEKNGVPIGSRQIKCESRMRELDQLLKSADNPLDFMCQTLGFSLGDREQLETFLVKTFQRNLPPNFNLFNKPTQINGSRKMSATNSPEELPTLLHFAARYGLEKLAWQLIECPGGDQACELRNCADLTPHEIAEAAGYTKLAATLHGYTQMNEFSSMYSYLKMAAESSNNKVPKSPSIAGSDAGGDEYHMPRPINETYQVPPAARPVPRPLPSPMDSWECDEAGYLEMLPAPGRSPPMGSLPRANTPQRNAVANHSYSLQPVPNGKKDMKPPVSTAKPKERSESSRPSDDKQTSARKAPLDQCVVQDELAEIINDFKNNVFTIAEVEKLVENWKNRNDVQQSYKEKQEQLNKMREQYEKLQEKMKSDTKRATPFERIRKVFKGRSRAESKEMVSMNTAEVKTATSTLHPTSVENQRPPSSLSLNSISSSSSSERMSTLSACSLGDSGTHSDPEDRKSSAPPLIVEEYEPELPERPKTNLQSNYQVPPSMPRPVMEARNKPKFQLQLTENPPYDRPPIPLPRPGVDDNDSYYITVCGNPPPVEVSVEPATPDYTNVTPVTEDVPNYINYGLNPAPPVPPRI